MSNVSFDYWADVLGRKCMQVLDVTFLHCVKSHCVLQDMSADDVAREVTAGAAAAPNPIPFSSQPHSPTPCPSGLWNWTSKLSESSITGAVLLSSSPEQISLHIDHIPGLAQARETRALIFQRLLALKKCSRARECAAAPAADVCVCAAVMVRELRRSTQARYSAVCSSAGTHALPPDATQPFCSTTTTPSP